MARDNTNKVFWERVARIYTRFMSGNDAVYDAICKHLEKYINNEKLVLELACGTGQITYRMAGKVKAWVATDYSENMVEEAKGRNTGDVRYSNLSFCVQDATGLNYEKETFDVVVIANALHIMPNPDAALKEIYRVLKKDGILFAPTFVYEKGYSKMSIWMMERLGFKTYHKWQKRELAAYVSGRGFHVTGAHLLKAKPLPECVLIAQKCDEEGAYAK